MNIKTKVDSILSQHDCKNCSSYKNCIRKAMNRDSTVRCVHYGILLDKLNNQAITLTTLDLIQQLAKIANNYGNPDVYISIENGQETQYLGINCTVQYDFKQNKVILIHNSNIHNDC